MGRTLLWVTAGLVMGVIIHLVAILSLPALATQDLWGQISKLDSLSKMTLLDEVAAGAPNPLGLDPKLVVGVCRLNLAAGPGVVSGTLPNTFWSVSVFDRFGVAIYSTTNRSGISNTLDLGIFNADQTRLLAEHQFEIEQGFLIVESAHDDVFVAVRIAPPHEEVRARHAEALRSLSCSSVPGP